VFRRLFLLPNFVAAQQTYNHNSKLELRKKKKKEQRIEQNSNFVSRSATTPI
jgi:ribosomal protein L9